MLLGAFCILGTLVLVGIWAGKGPTEARSR